jgi:hypothetical protein
MSGGKVCKLLVLWLVNVLANANTISAVIRDSKG